MFGCVKTLLLFYQTNFRVNINAEFLADRSPHGIRKSDNIRSRGTTRVHQHQRLPAVHRSRPQRLAFPATPVYHPGSRYLYPTGIHIIVGHVRIFPLQRLELPTRHDGVHKKTTRIAQHLRVGQLALTDVLILCKYKIGYLCGSCSI